MFIKSSWRSASESKPTKLQCQIRPCSHAYQLTIEEEDEFQVR